MDASETRTSIDAVSDEITKLINAGIEASSGVILDVHLDYLRIAKDALAAGGDPSGLLSGLARAHAAVTAGWDPEDRVATATLNELIARWNPASS